jgi:ribonucleoside-diphosphate reductase alpha chain
MRWQPPAPLAPYQHNWGRPAVDWSQVVEGILRSGIRNAAQTTIAPTGTIATVAGCEGYGCEPVFALAYIRHVNDNGKDLQLTYASPLFEQALQQAASTPRPSSSCSPGHAGRLLPGHPGIPAEIREVFVVSADISAEEHVRMQAALQAFVDTACPRRSTSRPAPAKRT